MKKCLRWPLIKKGFTLIELMVVIMLFAMVAFIANANLSFLYRMLTRAELDHLYTQCHFAQRTALMVGEPQQIVFDVANRLYSQKNVIHRLPAHVQFGAAPQVKGPPSSPEVVVTNPVTFKNKAITFYPDGVVQAGSVYLTDDNRSCTYALSSSVGSVSYLRKYQYTGKWKLIN